MASSTAKISLCKTCNKVPSVFFCRGCQKDFCTDHAKEHRQELSKQLDTIIVEHDQLKQNLAESMSKSTRHPLLKKVDIWETQSIDKIRMMADDVRKQLLSALDNHTTKITEDLKHLTKELTTARSEKKYLEMDLKKWMEKLEKCTNELRASPSINLQYDQNRTPFIRKIVVNLKKHEFFDRMAGNMRIEDNGQVIIAESDTHSTVRCQDDYSSGQHKFRFMIEQLNKNNWICFLESFRKIHHYTKPHVTPPQLLVGLQTLTCSLMALVNQDIKVI